MKECVEVNTHVVQSILEAIGTQSTDSILFADWHKTGCQEGLQFFGVRSGMSSFIRDVLDTNPI